VLQPLRFVVEAPPLKAEVAAQPMAETRSALSLVDTGGDIRTLAELEAEVIRFAISHCRGRMSEVARRLGIGRSTLYRKLENLGVPATGSPEDCPSSES
jgi:DNA-binding NtrC family response regulator